ncbi:hypothetical protein M426DRAFT_91639 [Hypoxylon sp. CI-4A]|nr:hypothetical protein M426DRAFT_91639 [Hypoxylon sp. CI-4A]
MSGLAQQARARREAHGISTGRYLAGLWEKTLLDDMSWCVGRSRIRLSRIEDGGRNRILWDPSGARNIGEETRSKPDEYIAPSWSWASIMSSVEFAPFSYKTHLCQILNVQTEPIGPYEYGIVAGGHVLLQGRLL